VVQATGGLNTTIGPRKKRYDESVGEPPKLVENESVEQIEDSKKSNSPAFEE
jgi:hypothetical protein